VTAHNRPPGERPPGDASPGGGPAWARPIDGGWLLELRVQPGARRPGIAGPLGDALKVRVTAPADAGKANAELVRFVATWLGAPRSTVRIVRGTASRSKTIEVRHPVPVERLDLG